MFQRGFAILFFVFGQQVITRKPSYLKLTKGDTKEKDTKEISTWLKLHWLVKFALSNRATGVWPVGFVGEKVNVLIEIRRVSRVHVLSKAWIWLFYVVVLQTAWLFQKSFSVFYGSGIAQELPLDAKFGLCDDLSWWLIQKTFRGLHPLPYLVRPRV